MPVQVTYPGVYVQEAPSGVHSIAQVATSVAAFVGMTSSGPVNVPTAVFSYREYDRIFGGTVYVGELSDQVRQFFLNGGAEAWIVRNAANALDGGTMVAKSTLFAEPVGANAPNAKVLVVSAKNAGTAGNNIQIGVDYDTSSPERTFNLTVLLPVTKSNGSIVFEAAEPAYKNLSMDPASPRFAPLIVSRQSDLINVAVDSSIGGPTTVTPLDATANVSQSGLIFDAAAGSVATFVTNKLAGGADRLMFVSVANGPPVRVNLQGLPTANDAAVTGAIQTRFNSALQDAGQTATVNVALAAAAGGQVLTIQSNQGPVVITSAPSFDVAGLLALGVANGGLEADAYSARRPAPTGMLTRVHGNTAAPGAMFARIDGFAAAAKNSVGNWKIDASPGHGGTAAVPEFTGAKKMADDTSIDPSVVGTFNAVAKMLDALVASINGTPAVSVDFTAYRAGMRVGIRPKYGSADSDLLLALSSPGATGAPYTLDGANNIAQTGTRPTNVLRYPIGLALPAAPAPPGGAYRSDLQAGNDGNFPLLADYLYSWDKLERVADIFNILVLPRAQGIAGRQTDVARAAIWPSASQFCRRLRAFLIVDPPTEDSPSAWLNVAAAVGDIPNFRGPLEQDYAAVYWPRVITNDPTGAKITLDPAGTIAGLYAKTDTRRGVWKAPAGLEATLMGVTGLELYVTNDENGRTNPQAINTLRMKVSGVTSWGARTLMGFDGTADEDYRYVPVRRLALMIEESLYRGLQFAVFEPNAEPLWGQIRLAAGSFMNGLFKEGAFKGLKASDAYYVACGPSTTSQRDINLGIVNVEVGFAPLKPAEFVVITIKQLAGQIEV
jgi:phage tail sheath protein FI